ncbi:hypothetical protein BY996DRAFT_6605166 [Phakopsora pachyrhizi]|nr:hypothetical protein BY996DRAFT_6605166 [Phakopsora pachyrhizi]
MPFKSDIKKTICFWEAEEEDFLSNQEWENSRVKSEKIFNGAFQEYYYLRSQNSVGEKSLRQASRDLSGRGSVTPIDRTVRRSESFPLRLIYQGTGNGYEEDNSNVYATMVSMDHNSGLRLLIQSAWRDEQEIWGSYTESRIGLQRNKHIPVTLHHLSPLSVLQWMIWGLDGFISWAPAPEHGTGGTRGHRLDSPRWSNSFSPQRSDLLTLFSSPCAPPTTWSPLYASQPAQPSTTTIHDGLSSTKGERQLTAAGISSPPFY